MASTATASNNPSAPSRTREINNSKTGEPGSATRGRGYRGRGGRGGRGGYRGHNKNAGNPPAEKQDNGLLAKAEAKPEATPAAKPETPAAPAVVKPSTPAPSASKSTPAPNSLPAKPSAPPTPAVEKTQSSNRAPSGSAPPARSKPNSRRASRNVVPTVVVAPQVERTSSTESPSTPTSGKGRRKRNNHNKGSHSVSMTPTLSVPQDIRRGNRTGPPSPLAPSMEASPRLSSTLSPNSAAFDIRSDIDALVDRVRAVAMAEHRPTTPGSHIDWAGEDDDSLPDLDDWGVKTIKVDEPVNTMSPIVLGGLKPLPEPAEEPPAIVANKSNTTQERIATPPKALPPSLSRNSSRNDIRATKPSGPTPEKPHQAPPAPAQLISSIKTPPKPPLHPSLPAKPTTEQVDLVKPKPPQTPTRARAPEKPVNIEITPPVVKATVALNETDKSPVLDEDNDDSKPGVSQSIHAPTNTENKSEKEPLPAKDPEEEGLGSSMHAPKPGELPLSPPNNRSPRHGSGPYHHAHKSFSSRNPRPQTAPMDRDTFPPHFTRSGPTSPQSPPNRSQRGGYHARNHSSPSTNGHRSPSSRPVITGAAISALARTIGSGGGGSPRANPTPVVKE